MQRIAGQRGELQGLSHLAQLGDLNSAVALEKLALKHVDGDSKALKTDSRLVLIGFGLERLQNGKEGSAEELVEMNRELIEEIDDNNVMAMVTMAQTRQWLDQLEHRKESLAVRNLILEKFGRSSDPNIAQMAAQYAGSVQFDGIDRLIDAVTSGEEVSEDRWREAVNTLLDESMDIASVQYLCGSALQFEGGGNANLAAVTYDVLEQRVASQNNAMAVDAQLAIDYSNARKNKIGQPFRANLLNVYGDVESVDDLKGQVVLMPFWTTRFPDSLRLLPLLAEIESAHPESVSVVGINLDATSENLRLWMQNSQLELPTVQTPFDESAGAVNPIAAEFGMGGRPMTVILDQSGNIAAIEFGDANLQQRVEDLLEQGN
ncbi:MAG: TlpA disulfide reductase family protein [Planctomycetota bacterium]